MHRRTYGPLEMSERDPGKTSLSETLAKPLCQVLLPIEKFTSPAMPTVLPQNSETRTSEFTRGASARTKQ